MYTKCQTIAGIRNVRWSEHNAISALGGLVYFSNFLSETGLFEEWVKECPLNYESKPYKFDPLFKVFLMRYSLLDEESKETRNITGTTIRV